MIDYKGTSRFATQTRNGSPVATFIALCVCAAVLGMIFGEALGDFADRLPVSPAETSGVVQRGPVVGGESVDHILA